MKIQLFIILLLFSTFAAAHNRVGNGGGAWVCRSAETIHWIQGIDLFEAQVQYGLNLPQVLGDYRNIATAITKKIFALPGSPFADLQSFVRSVNNLEEGAHIHFVDKKLPVINDALYFAIPKASSCKAGHVVYEQIVNYTNDGEIYIQRKLFDALSAMDKAALVIHEAIYAQRRSVGDTDSLNSRRIVGLVFSDYSPSVISWYLGFLKTHSAPVFPHTYEINMTKINFSGEIQPLVGISLSLSGDFDANSEKPITLRGKSNDKGFLSMDVDRANGFHIHAPRLSVKLDDGIWYSANLPPNGWATGLLPTSSFRAQYSCAVVTFLGSKQVHLTCVPKNMNSPQI